MAVESARDNREIRRVVDNMPTATQQKAIAMDPQLLELDQPRIQRLSSTSRVNYTEIPSDDDDLPRDSTDHEDAAEGDDAEDEDDDDDDGDEDDEDDDFEGAQSYIQKERQRHNTNDPNSAGSTKDTNDSRVYQDDDSSEDQQHDVSVSSKSFKGRKRAKVRKESIDWSNPAKNLMISKLLREAFLSVPNFRLLGDTFQELCDVINRHFPNDKVLVTPAVVKYKRDDLRKFYQVLMDLKGMEIAKWDEEKFQVSFTDDQWNIIAHFMISNEAARPKLPFLSRLRYRDSNPDLKLFKGIYDYKARQTRRPDTPVDRTVPTTEEIREAERNLKDNPLENFFKRVSKDSTEKKPAVNRSSPKRQKLTAKERKRIQREKEDLERRERFESIAMDPEILALQGVAVTSNSSLTPSPTPDVDNNKDRDAEEVRAQQQKQTGTIGIGNGHYNGDDESAGEGFHDATTGKKDIHQDQNRRGGEADIVEEQDQDEDSESDDEEPLPPPKRRKTVRFSEEGDPTESIDKKDPPAAEKAPKSILKDPYRLEKNRKQRKMDVAPNELTAEQLIAERDKARQEKAKREKEEIRERDAIIEMIYQRVEELLLDRQIGSTLYRQFLSIDALDVYAFFRYKYRLNDKSVAMCVQVLVEISQAEYE